MRNLLGRLLERAPAELERIAGVWAIELRGYDRHSDVSFLYRTMTDIWAMRDVWERIRPDGRLVTGALAEVAGEALPATAIADQTKLPVDIVRSELLTLHDTGIVARDERKRSDADREQVAPEPHWFLPREISMLLERVTTEQIAGSPRDLALDDLLATAPYTEIEEAATAWGARVIPALHARGELIGIVRDQLAQADRIERHIAALSDPARNAWARLKQAGGELPVDTLFPPADVPLATRRRILRELAAPLLIWHGYTGDTRLVVVPHTILYPTPVEVVPPAELRDVHESDVVAPEWLFPYASAWDLLTIVRDITPGPLTMTAAPRWKSLAEGDPAIIRRLRRRLWRADPESFDLPTGYIQFLVRVGALMGVLREDDDRAVPGDAAASWREHAFTTANQRMVAAWAGAEDWIEGRERVDASLYGASWPATRAALLRAIGELEEERWYDEERFTERLLQTQPELLRQAQVAAVPVGRRRPVDTSADARDRRTRVLTLVIGTTLETACTWLGLIERSYELGSERPVLRVTPFGRWIAGKRVEPAVPGYGQSPLEVGANFQLLLYRPTPRRVWALSAFSELEALDRVSSWTITAEALIRALANGIDLEQIVTFLERQNAGPLPQNVGYTLAEWDRGYRRIWLRRSVVLVPEEGEESEPVVVALREAGLEPELLADGRILLVFDDPDAGERLFTAATRALRERGFAPLGRRS